MNSLNVILASASPSRQRLLTSAGVQHEATAANIDEIEIKRSLKAEGASAIEVAETLAELKAARISHQNP